LRLLGRLGRGSLVCPTDLRLPLVKPAVDFRQALVGTSDLQVARTREFLASPDFQSNRFVESLMWSACSVPFGKDNIRCWCLRYEINIKRRVVTLLVRLEFTC